jgi:hypothetical protein
MMRYRNYLLGLLLAASLQLTAQQLPVHQQMDKGNPLIPGYFADPTIKKIGDTYYIYATTDGNGGGLGPSTVWTSKDFVNWQMTPMNWPNTHHYWAPDMTKGYDGRYYLYYSQPVELYGGVSESPVGPWTSIVPDNKSFIPNYMIPGVITLDGQTFTDDDGQIYMYWGTWGIYPNHGCAVGLLNKDMKTFKEIKLIPNTVAIDFFEAPVMFKRNGIYYLLYSSGHCEDHTYRVQYVKSSVGPMGPFEYPEHNPILVTNADGTIHGPGHNGILQEGEDVYMVYHRHNNPHSGGGFHRQVAVDRLEFDEKGDIKNVVPTHEGIGFLAPNTRPEKDRAKGKKVTASSFYNADFRPSFAVDNNNGTLWKAADNMKEAWLQIDLGSVQPVRSILTDFEYATYYYQYLIETSSDGIQWATFADQRQNTRWGSPMIDRGDTQARFVRVRIYDTQMAGMFKAIWNIKVYSEAGVGQNQLSESMQTSPKAKQGDLLIDWDANELALGSTIQQLSNQGSLKGHFNAQGKPYVALMEGNQGVYFSGKDFFESSFEVPPSMSGNGSFSASFWVFNPTVERNEPMLSWTRGTTDLSRAIIGYGSDPGLGAVTHGAWPDMSYRQIPKAGEWKHIAVTFDGYIETIYVDGKIDKQANKMLFLQRAKHFTIGSNEFKDQYFSGLIGSMQVYDRALSEAEILVKATERRQHPLAYAFKAVNQPYGPINTLQNSGYNRKSLVALGKVGLRIDDVGGRMAVVIPSGAQLNTTIFNSLLNGSFSSTSEFWVMPMDRASLQQWIPSAMKTNRWHHVVVSNESGTMLWFVDGQAVSREDSKRATKWYQNLSTQPWTMSNIAISEWNVYDRSVDAEWIKNRYKQQIEQLNSSPLKAAFASNPVFVSSSLIYMQAETVEGEDIQYQFAEVGNEAASVWQTQPYFTRSVTSITDRLQISLKVRDRFGRVSEAQMAPALTAMHLSSLQVFDSQAATFDLKKGDIPSEPFTGVFLQDQDSVSAKVIAKDGLVTLSSTNSKWDGMPFYGPFLFHEVEGDFLAQVEIVDVSGKSERKASPNESGLMLRAASGTNRRTERLIQSSVMTGWNVGNLVTSLQNGGRPQLNNGQGWNYDPFLQIQRAGAFVFVRSSKDGMNWKDLPGSPYVRKDLEGQKLQLGVFQATNDDNPGYATFKDFKLFIPSK